MIVCSCNAIREDEIRTAARRGTPCVETAYKSLGCELQCGSCACHAEEIIQEERDAMLRVDKRAA